MQENLFPDQANHDTDLDEILAQVQSANSKQGLLSIFEHINTTISQKKVSSSEKYITSVLSKLLRHVLSQRSFQSSLIQDPQTQEKLIALLNNAHISRLALYQILLPIVDHLEINPLSEVKLAYDRRSFFEEIILSTLIEAESTTKLCNELFQLESIGEFTEILRSLFSFPNRLANYLENCPSPLRQENFFLVLLEASLKQEDSFKRKREQYYTQFVNSLFINGQTSNSTIIRNIYT